MFENISQLNLAMKEVLEIFQQDKEISSIFSKYPSKDLVEAINTCLTNGFLTGVSCDVGAQGDVVVNTWDPHVTASGNTFISEI